MRQISLAWVGAALLFGWAALTNITAYSQTSTGDSTPTTPVTCGSDDYTQRRMATDSAYRAFVQNARPSETTNKADNDAILTIPVIFVVYHLGEALGQGSNVPESALQAQVELMNQQFGATLTTVSDNGAIDSRIRFVMARRNADCTPFNGVFRIDGRAVPGYQAVGVDYSNGIMQTRMRDLAGTTINQMGQQAVIVRVFWQVTGAGGWAGFGGDISVAAPSMFNNSLYSSLMTHEMGHVLFLHHTFQGDNDNANCPPNTNPATQGDEVADTPPHLKSSPSNACSEASESLINTCTGLPFGKIPRNFMSYGCNTYLFTPGQIARMRGYLAGSLSRFVNSPYAFPPTVGENLVAAACVPASGLSSTLTTYHSEGIARVRLNTLNSSTNYMGSQPLFFQDLSCQQQTTLRTGQSYTLTVEAPNNNVYRRAYIDWNNDGVFDEATERVYTANIGEETAVITVPATAVTTQALRMRVVVCDGNTPPSACLVPTFGAAQDFGVRIETVSPSPQIRLGQLNSLTYCSGKPVLLPYTLTNGDNLSAVTVWAELSDVLGSFANPILLTTGTGGLLTAELPVTLPSSLTIGTGYRIRLTSTNPSYASDQTPPLTIRQSPTGTLIGPATLREGQVASLTVSLTGGSPWLLTTLVSPASNDYSLPGQYNASFTMVTSSTVLVGQPRGTVVYRLGTIDNGCPATSTGAALTMNVSCEPPMSFTETIQNTTSVNLRWEDLGFRSYYVQWKESTAANWTNMTAQSGTIAYLTSLTLGRAYDWRVAISCANSTTSAYSPTRSFTLGCPIPMNPYEQVTPTSATLYWTYAGVLSYTVRWRTVGATNWTSLTVGSTNYALPTLVSGQGYEWQVSTNCNSNSTTSAFSVVRSFTTSCAPPATLYVGGVSSTTASVSWFPVSAGQQYRVQWRVAGASNWVTLIPVTTGSVALTSLPGGQVLEWQLQAVCSNSAVSAFQNGPAINVSCPVPLGVPTLSGVGAMSVLVGWPTQDVNGYSVQWRKPGAANWNTNSASSSTVAALAITGLEHNTAYEARYALVCRTNTTGVYSNPVSFTTLNCAPPALVLLTGNQTVLSGQTITLTASLTGAAPWSLLLSTGDSFTGISTSPALLTLSQTNPNSYSIGLTVKGVVVANVCQTVNIASSTAVSASVVVLPVCGAAPTNLRITNQTTNSISLAWDSPTLYATLQWRVAGTTSWTTVPNLYQLYYLNNLTYGQAYEWQLLPICYFGQPITPSAIQSFTMSCPVAANLSETYSPTDARLSWAWQGSAGTSVSYTLRWRSAGSANWTTVSPINTNQYSLTGLTANGAYEWQIQTVCAGGGVGLFSPIRSFTTGCSAPATPTATGTTSTSTNVVWSTGFSGVQYALRWRLTVPTSWTTGTTTFTGTAGSVTGLTGGSLYHVQLQAVCANGQRSPFSESSTFNTPTVCTVMYTLQAGNWTTPGIWSCNRIPTTTDVVEVRHPITLLSGTANARKVVYTAGGKLIHNAGGRLQLGF